MATARAEDRMFVGAFPFTDPTVLFWGSAGGLERFAALLRELGRKAASGTVPGELSWVTSIRDTEVRIEVANQSRGMKRLEADRGYLFRWGLSPSDASRFAELVDVVAAARKPGHHYLDSDGGDEFVVVVSRGEYDGWEV